VAKRVHRQMIRLEIAGQIHHRDVALRTVSAACRLACASRPSTPETDDVLHAVLSAVGEAFNNIAVHGYRGRAGIVQIEIAVGARKLAVELRDFGRSFDPSAVPAPDLDGLPESGLGVFIMSKMMDRVEYRPGRPNVLRLVKRLTPA
jgi:serine/threonine-protein kinase RsbW